MWGFHWLNDNATLLVISLLHFRILCAVMAVTSAIAFLFGVVAAILLAVFMRKTRPYSGDEEVRFFVHFCKKVWAN